VNKYVISMSDCCMFYASTYNVVTFFVQMSSSETEVTVKMTMKAKVNQNLILYKS
jgi:hypothetical protein